MPPKKGNFKPGQGVWVMPSAANLTDEAQQRRAINSSIKLQENRDPNADRLRPRRFSWEQDE